MTAIVVRLRPVVEDDLVLFRRFAVEPGLVGLDWSGFRDPQAPARRFATDGYLGAQDGRLIVSPDETDTAAGFVSWHAGSFGGPAPHWEIGIALLPEWRGQGLGWRAQAMLCDLPLPAHSRPAHPGRHPSGEHGRATRPGDGRLHARGSAASMRVPRRTVAGRIPLQQTPRRPGTAALLTMHRTQRGMSSIALRR